MGCDIHIVAQKRSASKWVDVAGEFSEGSAPFDWRSYGLFGFLAGVRNYSAVPPISEPRGLPDDIEDDGYKFGEHSFSWLSVKELSDFDYDQPLEDRRVTRQLAPGYFSGGCTAEPGEGEATTYRAFLGEAFFSDLRELQKIEAERVVFGFDS